MCLNYIPHFQAAHPYPVGHQLQFVQKQERLDYLVGLGSAFAAFFAVVVDQSYQARADPLSF